MINNYKNLILEGFEITIHLISWVDKVVEFRFSKENFYISQRITLDEFESFIYPDHFEEMIATIIMEEYNNYKKLKNPIL